MNVDWAYAAQSSAVVVHADYNYNLPRRVPQFLARGPFNAWGYDSGINAAMTHNAEGKWELEIMDNWPAYVQLNVFGYDDYFYGDVDGDGVLDRLPPNSAAPNYVNMSAPPKPYLAWTLVVDDATLTWTLQPRGSSGVGAIMYGLLLSIPIVTGTLAVLIFMWSFYGIKYNQFGVKPVKESSYFPIIGVLTGRKDKEKGDDHTFNEKVSVGHSKNTEIIGWPEDKNKRRKVLIATLEYEIIDWKLKVKIGGLGVMSSLMGKSMTEVDLVWVVPKVKDLRSEEHTSELQSRP